MRDLGYRKLEELQELETSLYILNVTGEAYDWTADNWEHFVQADWVEQVQYQLNQSNQRLSEASEIFNTYASELKYQYDTSGFDDSLTQSLCNSHDSEGRLRWNCTYQPKRQPSIWDYQPFKLFERFWITQNKLAHVLDVIYPRRLVKLWEYLTISNPSPQPRETSTNYIYDHLINFFGLDEAYWKHQWFAAWDIVDLYK